MTYSIKNPLKTGDLLPYLLLYKPIVNYEKYLFTEVKKTCK